MTHLTIEVTWALCIANTLSLTQMVIINWDIQLAGKKNLPKVVWEIEHE